MIRFEKFIETEKQKSGCFVGMAIRLSLNRFRGTMGQSIQELTSGRSMGKKWHI